MAANRGNKARTTATDGVEIVRSEGRLTITKRTYRAGDWAFMMLGLPALAIALMLLGMGISYGTLFKSWATPLIVAVILAWNWFNLTRAVNRRRVTADGSTLVRRDGPIPTLALRRAIPLSSIDRVRTYKSRHWALTLSDYAGMLSSHILHNVSLILAGGEDVPLYKKLLDEKTADLIKEQVLAHLASLEGPSGEG